MQKLTHFVVGAAIGMMFALVNFGDWYWFVLMGVFGAFLPDFLDFQVFGGRNHRNIVTHNFLSPLLLGFLLLGVILRDPFLVGCGITAFESHQLLDMHNPTGVYLWNRKIGGSVRYDNISVNLVYILGGSFVILMIFLYM